MCGIAGIISLSGAPVVDGERRVRHMVAMLHHRGPDGNGIYVAPDRGCALGYARLAISDPTNATPQPLRTVDGQAVLSFNGEIYNDLEVREQLERDGVRFRTRMDTEVLLEGLRRYGENFLHRLDGMWAFAYYDVRERRLFLSRDTMGERHCFYRIDRDANELLFASEVAPILAVSSSSVEIDLPSLTHSIAYAAAPPGRTLIRGVDRLLPGEHLVCTRDGGITRTRHRTLHPERWFEFFAKQPSLDTVIEEFTSIFHRSCARRLPRDVPYVSTLSGGIDSTLICAFASEFGKHSLTTLYGESSDTPRQQHPDELDEATASATTARQFHTTHLTTTLYAPACVPLIERFAGNGFDGAIDVGTLSFEMLAARVREAGRKVILISDGPDELVGGYMCDQRFYATDRLRSAHPVAYALLRRWSAIRGGPRVLRALGNAHLVISPDVSYQPFRSIPIHRSVSVEEVVDRASLNTPPGYGTVDPVYDGIVPHLAPDQLRALAYASRSLPDHFNLRTDKGFLRQSVECRLPYQATEMVEFLIAMPGTFRFGVRGETTKFLLREIVARRVNPAIAYRSKYGFSVPLFRHREVRDALRMEDVIRTTPLFDDFPFLPHARDFVLRPDQMKLRWPCYVLARTYERLQQRQFDGDGGRAPIVAAHTAATAV
ncbi:asparagine synthase (glutamine-hydrolyzing) [Candidatus Uhrbacteria bacterium]|nr:asparagine synthase (glutamine-hydrolyzing) [Candidatus Uhrbacteria bacterium]